MGAGLGAFLARGLAAALGAGLLAGLAALADLLAGAALAVLALWVLDGVAALGMGLAVLMNECEGGLACDSWSLFGSSGTSGGVWRSLAVINVRVLWDCSVGLVC